MNVFEPTGVYATDPKAEAAAPADEQRIGLRSPRPKRGISIERVAKTRMPTTSAATHSSLALSGLVLVAATFATIHPVVRSQDVRRASARIDLAKGVRVAFVRRVVDECELSAEEVRRVSEGLVHDVDAPPAFRLHRSSDHEFLTWAKPGLRVHVSLGTDPAEWVWWTVRRRGSKLEVGEQAPLGSDPIETLKTALAIAAAEDSIFA